MAHDTTVIRLESEKDAVFREKPVFLRPEPEKAIFREKFVIRFAEQGIKGDKGDQGDTGAPGADGAALFTELNDAFPSYQTRGLHLIRVNQAENAVESFSPSSDFLSQYVSKSPLISGRNLIQPGADVEGMVLRSRSGNTTDLFRAERYDQQKFFYVDNAGDVHLGPKPQYSSGGQTYRDSQKLWFDFFNNGSQRNIYLQAVPLNAGVNGEGILRVVVNGQNTMDFSSLGGLTFPGGAQFGASSAWLISGNGMRTTNGVPGTIRGEFNYISVQGEPADIAGNAAFIVNFVDPFNNSNPRVNGDIMQFKAANSIKAYVHSKGYIGMAGSLRMLGFLSNTADPTTTDIPSNKDLAIFKNTISGDLFLAYNDSGVIKKVALS